VTGVHDWPSHAFQTSLKPRFPGHASKLCVLTWNTCVCLASLSEVTHTRLSCKHTQFWGTVAMTWFYRILDCVCVSIVFAFLVWGFLSASFLFFCGSSTSLRWAPPNPILVWQYLAFLSSPAWINWLTFCQYKLARQPIFTNSSPTTCSDTYTFRLVDKGIPPVCAHLTAVTTATINPEARKRRRQLSELNYHAKKSSHI
jgi:hypothetical protein